MVIYGYIRLYMVIYGYIWLYMVIYGYIYIYIYTYDYMTIWLHGYVYIISRIWKDFFLVDGCRMAAGQILRVGWLVDIQAGYH